MSVLKSRELLLIPFRNMFTQPYIYYLLLLCLFLYSFKNVVPAEDAVILYEYSKNLAEKGIITYSTSTSPIEGATDFLWMLFIAIFKFIRIDEFASSLILNFFGALLLLRILNIKIDRLPIYIICLILTPYLFASLLGFSSIIFASVYVLCIYLALNRNKYLYLAVLILCLIRPDGVVWGIGVILTRVHCETDYNNIKKEIPTAILCLLIPGILYFIWRRWYFGEWLPLPFLVKSTGERDWLFFFKVSAASVARVLLPAVFAGFFVEKRARFLARLVMLLCLPALFYSAMRLEQNIGNRFLSPMFFGALFLFSLENKISAILVYTTLSILASYTITEGTGRQLFLSRNESVYFLSRELQKSEGKMLITETGRLSYYSNWQADDPWGLNTPRFAHRLINEQDIKLGGYDLIMAHCNLALFDSEMGTGESMPRSWDNMCRVLMSYMKAYKYEIYLVPFYIHQISDKSSIDLILGRNNDNCMRYDIYALATTGPKYAEMRNLVRAYGALHYPFESARYEDDRLCINGE